MVHFDTNHFFMSNIAAWFPSYDVMYYTVTTCNGTYIHTYTHYTVHIRTYVMIHYAPTYVHILTLANFKYPCSWDTYITGSGNISNV